MITMGLRGLVATTVVFAALCFGPTALAGKSTPEAVVALPAAGDLIVPSVVARSAPNPTAHRVLLLHQFRPDFRQQVVLAVGATVGSDGRLWYRLSLPMRPNNTFGYAPAGSPSVDTVCP